MDEVVRWVKSKGLQDDIGRYEADYRGAVLRRFDYMELLGADIPAEARRPPLSVPYVSLTLLAAGDGENAEDDGVGISRSCEALRDELSVDSRRLLIRGDAGSGKSTLCRRSALRAASPLEGQSRGEVPFGTSGSEADGPSPGTDPCPEAASRSWRDGIPFLIRLRDCPAGQLPSVDDLPREVARNVGSPPEAWVRGVLQNGRALLMFDGVDEVPNDRREDVRREIETIIQTDPRNFFLVSTRPAAVPKDWLAGEGVAAGLICFGLFRARKPGKSTVFTAQFS